MSYNFKQCHVPNTLANLISQINRFKKMARRAYTPIYKQLTKNYKKIDWSKKTLLDSQVKPYIAQNYFKCYRRMKADKQLRYIPITCNRYKIQKENLQIICLLRQVGVSLEEKYFDKISNYRKKPQYVPFYFESAYQGNIWICSHPKTLSWKAELLTPYLHTKEFLFDQSSPYFKGMRKTKRFIQKNLMNGKVQKWDYYVQRFLLQK